LSKDRFSFRRCDSDAHAASSLPDSQVLEPGVQGRWSVRDILAHVTTWEEEALTHLPLILERNLDPVRGHQR
jgi:hypothetical protein